MPLAESYWCQAFPQVEATLEIRLQVKRLRKRRVLVYVVGLRGRAEPENAAHECL